MSRSILALLSETSIHIQPIAPSNNDASVDHSQCSYTRVAREQTRPWPSLTTLEMQQTLADRGLTQISGKLDNGRLLLLPVRSLDSICSWVTCPALLGRFLDLFEASEAKFWLSSLEELSWTHGQALSNHENNRFFLEGFNFLNFGKIPRGVLDILGNLIEDEATRNRLLSKVILIGNDDFELLLSSGGIPIHVRGQFDPTKIRQNLRFEEALPPDTLFYVTVAKSATAPMKKKLQTALNQDPFLQIGSQETTGRGWFHAVLREIDQ